MFFDTSGGDNLTAINGTYKSFAEIATEFGFLVNHGLLTSISDEVLADIKVLVLPVPVVFLYDESKEALKRFIRAGGVVLIIGYVFPWTDYANLGGFAGEYGIQFGGMQTGPQYGSVNTSSLLARPEVVNRLLSPIGRIELTVDPSLAQAQALFDDGTVLTAISRNQGLLGKGKLIVHGDASMFAESAGYTYIGLENNRQFARNLISYIAGVYDLSCTSVRPKGQQNHGKQEKTIVRVRNGGTQPSSGAKLRLMLVDHSSQAEPSETGIQVAQISVPEIGPGKNRKLTINYKIPGYVAPGEYRFRAEIVPAAWPKDSRTDNNTRESKVVVIF